MVLKCDSYIYRELIIWVAEGLCRGVPISVQHSEQEVPDSEEPLLNKLGVKRGFLPTYFLRFLSESAIAATPSMAVSTSLFLRALLWGL